MLLIDTNLFKSYSAILSFYEVHRYITIQYYYCNNNDNSKPQWFNLVNFTLPIIYQSVRQFCFFQFLEHVSQIQTEQKDEEHVHREEAEHVNVKSKSSASKAETSKK